VFLEESLVTVSLKPPPVIKYSETLRELARRMSRKRVDHMIVSDEKGRRVLGSINIYELMKIIVIHSAKVLSQKVLDYSKREVPCLRENSKVRDLLEYWKNQGLSEVCVLSRGEAPIASTSPLVFVQQAAKYLKRLVSSNAFKSTQPLIAVNTTVKGVLRRAVERELLCFLVYRKGNILGVVDCFDVLALIADGPEDILSYTCSFIYKRLEPEKLPRGLSETFSPLVLYRGEVCVISVADMVRDLCHELLQRI